jgi:hypothetical protein
MRIETAATLLQSVPGGATQQRVDLLTLYQPTPGQTVPESAKLVVCSDEKTGRRFGQAKCRAGRCLKIGSGGRNKGSDHAYQIWAVWE